MTDRDDAPGWRTPATKWRLRERGQGIGVGLWAVAVVGLLTVAPQRVVAFLVDAHPFALLGTLLFTLGVCGGIGNAAVVLYVHWRRPPPEYELLYTEGANDD